MLPITFLQPASVKAPVKCQSSPARPSDEKVGRVKDVILAHQNDPTFSQASCQVRKDFLSNRLAFQCLFSADTSVAKSLHDMPIVNVDPDIDFSNAAEGVVGLASDLSNLGRTFPTIDMTEFGKDTALFPIAGMTSTFNTVQGAITAQHALKKREKMDELGLHSQKIDASIDFIRGLAQSACGGAFLFVRPLSIVEGLEKTPGTSLWGRVLQISSQAATGLVALINSCVLLGSVRKIFRLSSFSSKLQKAEDKARFLIKEVSEKQSASEILTTMLKGATLDAVKVTLKKKACNAISKQMQAWLYEAKKLGIEHKLADGGPKELVEKVFAHLNAKPDFKERLLKRMGLNENAKACSLSFEELLGLEVITSLEGEKKETQLSECIGQRACELVKGAISSNLIDRLASTDEDIKKVARKEAEDLVTAAVEGIRDNKKMSWALSVICFLGIATAALGLIPVAGVLVTAFTVVNLSYSISMFIVDITGLAKAQNDSDTPSGVYDRALLHGNTALCVASLAAIIIVGSIFSMGTLPIAMAVGIAAIWLGNNIYGYYKLAKKEKAYHEKHPTLQYLQKRIAASKASGNFIANEELYPLFKRLPVEDKKAVKAHLIGDSNDQRSLEGEDRKLDKHCDFGREFFEQNPSHGDVKRSIEKAWKTSSSPMLYTLHMMIDKLDKQEIKKFESNLSTEDQRALFQAIYNKRALKKSSRAFKHSHVEMIGKATNEVLASRAQMDKKIRKEALLAYLKRFNDLLKAVA